MERASVDVLESVISQLIDEESLGVCFELHRAIKLQYYDLLNPDASTIERHDIVDEPGRDVFGNNTQIFRKPVECVCPSCQRTLGASKFAPHLEKCLGMGRSSSRIAHRKTQVPVESEGEHSEDNEDEWTYPEKRGSIGPRVPKKIKRDKTLPLVPPPRKAAMNKQPLRVPDTINGNGVSTTTNESFYNLKPSLQQHNAASFSALPPEYKTQLLQQICGVISERTGRLCTRTIKCPQHSEEDRKEVRKKLLDNHPYPVDVSHHLPSYWSMNEDVKPELREEEAHIQQDKHPR